MYSQDDYNYMSRALNLARNGLYSTDPNPKVGCVIVKDRQIVGAGWHQTAGDNHAEINALKDAGNVEGATVYVTLEPCAHHGKTPPCAQVLVNAKVARVFVAMQDPNPQVGGKGIAALKSAGIKVELGLLEQDARELNPGFISRFTKKRPFIRLKLAMSLDGKTALASGESKWITGDAARADGHRFRARSSAIVTGIGTVLADNPSLNVRRLDTTRQPVRVVLDSRLRISPKAKILQNPGRTVIVCASNDIKKIRALNDSKAEIVQIPYEKKKINLSELMTWFTRQQFNEVHIEAGAALSGAMLEAALVDELLVYMAARVIGHEAKSLFKLNIANMTQSINFKIADVRMLGDDLRLVLHPK